MDTNLTTLIIAGVSFVLLAGVLIFMLVWFRRSSARRSLIKSLGYVLIQV
jgi:hypothetical protein